MADGYLETHYAEYEKRKAAWLKRKKYANLIKQLQLKQTNNGRKTPTDPS